MAERSNADALKAFELKFHGFESHFFLMTYSEGLFLFLSFLLINSALLTVSAKNPVYSVLFLILSFLNGTGLLLLLGLEFLGLTFLIVYIGAISVLFLFVVMLLNLQTINLNENRTAYLPVGILLGLILGAQIFSTTYKPWQPSTHMTNVSWTNIFTSVDSLARMGETFYTDFWTLFELAGVLLLLAMIGTIRLTLYHQPIVKRQDLKVQIYEARPSISLFS